MQITTKANTRLVAASSPLAAQTEIHEMKMDNGVMKMRAIAGVEVTPAEPVSLTPSGSHLMLFGLKSQLKTGDVVPITLVFEGKDKKRQTVEVSAVARALNSAAPR